MDICGTGSAKREISLKRQCANTRVALEEDRELRLRTSLAPFGRRGDVATLLRFCHAVGVRTRAVQRALFTLPFSINRDSAKFWFDADRWTERSRTGRE